MKTRWMAMIVAGALVGCGTDTGGTDPDPAPDPNPSNQEQSDAGTPDSDAPDGPDAPDAGSDTTDTAGPDEDVPPPVDMEPPTYGEWFENFGGVDADIIEDLATDDEGNVYATGTFRQTLTVAGEVLVAVESDSDPTEDVFVASWGPSGEFRWAKSFGSDGNEKARGIAVGPDGGVFVVADSQGEVTFGTSVLPNLGQGDIVAVKYDRDGAYQWSQSWGGQYTENARAITVNEAGDLFITGSWQGLFTAGDRTYSAETDWSAMEVLVMSVDGATGAVKWSNSFNGFLVDTGTAIAADSEGNVAVGVSLNYDLDIDGDEFDAGDSFDGAIVRLDDQGNVVWAEHLAAQGANIEVLGIAIDDEGEVYATGVFEDTVNFGGNDLVNPVRGHDVFVLGLDADGNHRFSSSWGGEGFDQPLDMTARDGALYVAGRYDGEIMFDSYELSAMGDGYDIFVVSVGTADGKVRWARGFGGPLDDQANAVAVDPWRGVYVAGYQDGGGFMFNDQPQPAASEWVDAVVFRLEE